MGLRGDLRVSYECENPKKHVTKPCCSHCIRAYDANSTPAQRGVGRSTMQAYCVKCRTQRDMNNPRDEMTKNGRPIIKGTCAVCGTGLNIIGKTIAQMK